MREQEFKNLAQHSSMLQFLTTETMHVHHAWRMFSTPRVIETQIAVQPIVVTIHIKCLGR